MEASFWETGRKKLKNLKKPFYFLAVLVVLIFGGSISVVLGEQDVNRPGVGDVSISYDTTAVPTVTPSPQLTATLLPEKSPTQAFLPSQFVAFSQDILIFIDVPSVPQNRPYAVLYAYETLPGNTPPVIKGTINQTEFVCDGTPCILPVEQGATIEFWAVSSSGKTSERVTATISVDLRADGYYTSIAYISQFLLQNDVCSQIWGFQNPSNQSWAEFSRNPNQLNTQKKLHYLTEQLITSGIVNAVDCPGGGLTGGAPNACGIERAFNESLVWQNRYDFHIWLSGRDIGIPHKLLKTLIEIESQFWPANSRYYFDEFGLGQINQYGIDVLLRQNPLIYQQYCPLVLSDCSRPYGNLSAAERGMIRGVVLKSFDATCADCPFGLNPERADQTIPFIAMLLKANCAQTEQILDLYKETTGYEDYWKFTLVAYHGGMGCLQNAVKAVSDKDFTVNWANVSAELQCRGAKDYVDRFWSSLTSFDSNVLRVDENPETRARAQIAPTPTPSPTPTPFLSNAIVQVYVVVDANQNGIPDENEWVDDITVNLEMPDGTILTAKTVKGLASFDMNGYLVGDRGVVSLPGLYRTSEFEIPPYGIVPVIFVFSEPILPNVLP